MITIHKFILFKQFTPQDEVVVKMPRHARILSVGEQDDQICAWALVNTDNVLIERKFHIYGTGWDLGKVSHDPNNHVATIVSVGPYNLVWHIFESFL